MKKQYIITIALSVIASVIAALIIKQFVNKTNA
jgi:hypothetical protein